MSSPVNLLGSIPARAGEPVIIGDCRQRWQVYPRACGGTEYVVPSHESPLGLSPRVRGNRLAERVHADNRGSIPARAGEPCEPIDPAIERKVYPRACGGTVRGHRFTAATGGLSPRVRGNRHPSRWGSTIHRSIPARAGEPSTATRWSQGMPVYPRACGGTQDAMTYEANLNGLSPRVRGNQRSPQTPAMGSRSIPARAGEPHVSCRSGI